MDSTYTVVSSEILILLPWFSTVESCSAAQLQPEVDQMITCMIALKHW